MILLLSNLEWQGTYTNPLPWELAKEYVVKLRKKSYYEDWRLPTVEELYAAVDVTKVSVPVAKVEGMPVDVAVWSADEYALDRAQAWTVSFNDGSVRHCEKQRSFRVRCVRTITFKE